MKASDGVFYLRYNDDVIILTKTNAQYQRARRRLFSTLRSLKLRVSPKKTKMGALTAFHFLGVQFALEKKQPGTRTPALKSQVNKVAISLHARSCHRALEKVTSQIGDAFNTANILRYLFRWATWWHQSTSIPYRDLINAWIADNGGAYPSVLAFGVNLLYICEFARFDR